MAIERLISATKQVQYFATENLTREAFWNVYKPGCDEHLILHQLRKSRAYIPELDLVALLKDEIIGHIISTKARVVDPGQKESEVLCVGPFSVSAKYRKRGVGSELMQHSIAKSRQLGYRGMILFGDPGYYQRFGFSNAMEFGITTKKGQNFEAFMAMELQKNGLRDIKGKFFEDEAFTVNNEHLLAFEKKFPHKEKKVTDTQLHL